MTNSSRRYVVPDHVLSRHVGDEAVLLSMESERYFALEGAGPRIWALLCEKERASASDLVAVLSDEYEVDSAVLESDVLAMLASLHGHGLIEAE
ncbi:MAG: PqqD family protein [Ilumatobacteraceae bacterium]